MMSKEGTVNKKSVMPKHSVFIYIFPNHSAENFEKLLIICFMYFFYRTITNLSICSFFSCPSSKIILYK